ncbi:hypothetical protein [Spirosoma endbachense]|uniref:Uncharacterized protein n=1 Tax=Spirosoma endbachense TaxID=2666025 RepID=A0A6P1W3T2_9BACT|nr:hypothetical protein [Spirosoma endbachense]QHV99554.1 hypothetical protein GJR95_33095 [Spirosoma endbachense]
MRTTLLPYRQINYQTELTPDQIRCYLSEHVITGFSFYSHKPYYGDFTTYSFSVRKVSSKIKKQSFAPSIEGMYKSSKGKTLLSLSLSPSPVLIVAFLLFAFPLALFLFFSVSEFFKTGDLNIVISGLMPIVVWYGIFWLIFQMQSSTDIRFWVHILDLRESPAL